MRFKVRVDNSTFSTEPWKFGKDYWSSFELYPEWTGSTFYGFRGVAYHRRDYWSETPVVVKTFRHRDGRADDWRPYEMRCRRAAELARHFNKHLQAQHFNARVRFVDPTHASMDSRSDIMYVTRFVMGFTKKFVENEVVLIEDLLEGAFKTFVTNQGQATCDESQLLDSFAHFTYQASDGQLVVCNLKGVENEGKFELTNPVIHSCDGLYGDSDKRGIGIQDFFQNHICTPLCQDFLKPAIVFPRIPSAPSTLTLTGSTTSSKELDADDRTPMLSDDDFQPPMYMTNDPFAPPPYKVMATN